MKMHAPAAGDSPAGFRLLRHFSVTSFISMALAAWFTAFLFQRIEHRSMLILGEAQNVAITQVFANALWPSLSGFLLLSRTMTAAEIRQHPLIPYLDQFLRKLMGNLKVLQVKIHNGNGVTLYASRADQIGEDQSGNHGVSTALTDRLHSEQVHAHDFVSHDGQVTDRNMIVTYVPLFRDDRVRGVFELYYDIGELLEQMHRVQHWMVLGVTGLFLALYGVLFGIIRRADFLIGAQHQRLSHYLAEIRRSHEDLEKRVAERTETLRLTNDVLKSEIIERQQAETELRKLTRAVEQSPVSVIITDLTGRIEYVNPKFCLVSGYAAAEVMGRNPSLLKSGKVNDHTYRELWETLARGEEWRGEFLNRKKNGECYWELASISPIRGRFGEVTHYLAVKEDITDIKAAQTSLQDREMHLRLIMDNVTDGIILVSGAGRIESGNPALERLFGHATSELIGQDVEILLPELSGSATRTCLGEWLAAGGSGLVFQGEIDAWRHNRARFPLELTIHLVRTAEQHHFIATMRDISARRQAEQHLAELRHSQFHQEKMIAVGTLAAGILHEINNPTAAITGILEALRDLEEGDDPDRRALLDLMHEQIDRITNITRDVSDFTQSQPTEIQLIDLNDLLQKSVRLMRFDKRMRAIRVNLDLDRELPAIDASASQLRQVFINLLLNAADALEGCSPQQGEVVISTSRQPPWVRMTIADNGSGMEQDVLSRIFDPFFTTKPAGRGTGLGLSVCHTIVTNHGGSITVHSRPGEGCVFSVLLPVGEGMS
ncbi:MAG: PAS domain S-box protein [Magnetococcales bacterium]|nr:PAS domain S-box protein [Magnetococcales bacterium]